MESKYTKTLTILPSQLDPYGRLSAVQTFNLFMDTATEAADAIDVGVGFLRRKGLFWITVKARVEWTDPPKLMDTVELVTWPETPGDRRWNRHYEIRREGAVLVRGKTEWAIVDAQTHRPRALAGLAPDGLEYSAERACPESFPQIDEAFPGPPFAEHRVTATDIDMAFHMNNVAYVRAIVDAFSVEAWHALKVRRMDVIFRTSAHEGDTLAFQKRREGRVLDIRGSLPDGTTIVMARLTCDE